jgi:MFS family permease
MKSTWIRFGARSTDGREPTTAADVRAINSRASDTMGLGVASHRAAAIGGLIAMASLVGVGRFVYTPILPPMSAALGLSQATAGVIASANCFGYLIGAFLAATRLVPGSRRRWLIVALAVSALTTGTMGLVSTVPAFVALRFLGGVASAFALVFSSALVLDRLAAGGGSELSAVHFAGVVVGIAVSAAVVSALIAAGFDCARSGSRAVAWRASAWRSSPCCCGATSSGGA